MPRGRNLNRSQRAGDTPLETLRRASQHAIRTSTLRGTAREVGLSPSGLQKFVDGGTPYRITRKKLAEWYARYAAEHGGSVAPEAGLAALDVITFDFPSPIRERVGEELRDVLRRAYTAAKQAPPEWL